jgi:hypothetical protein
LIVLVIFILRKRIARPFVAAFAFKITPFGQQYDL